MRYFLKKTLTVLAMIIGFSTLISAGSLWSLRNGSFYKPSYLVNSVDEDSFDYIVLGASTGLTSLNTKIIDSILGFNGLNLSMDDTSLSSQYLMLKHFIAQGKTTNYCILAPSVRSYESKRNTLNDNDYRFLMYVNQPYVSDYYRDFNGTRANVLYLSKWLPTVGVSYYNAELFYPSLLSLLSPDRRNRFDERGNYSYPIVASKHELIKVFDSIAIGFSNPFVSKIEELCKIHNIKLICYLSPMEGKNAVLESNLYSVINHVALIKDRHYFNDAIHVNYLGNRLASKEFAKDFSFFINRE
jgi:hypothetical protein